MTRHDAKKVFLDSSAARVIVNMELVRQALIEDNQHYIFEDRPAEYITLDFTVSPIGAIVNE